VKILSVPGNLLLLGEYAVLEEGGMGLAFAVEPRVRVESEAASRLTIESRFGSERVAWSREPELREPRLERSRGKEPGLIRAVVASCEEEVCLPSLRILVDASRFYDSQGHKVGLGSSAASAVGIAAALLEGASIDRLPERLFAVALRAHRAFQQGRGSGYDVAASAYGGIGLFTGGRSPSFRAASLPWLPPFRLVRASSPVRTPDAIGRYLDWKGHNEGMASRFVEESNLLVQSFVTARSWSEARPALLEAKRLGLWLGDAIGVSAALDLTGQGLLSKALGAGNELAAVWQWEAESPAIEAATAVLSERGLTWKE